MKSIEFYFPGNNLTDVVAKDFIRAENIFWEIFLDRVVEFISGEIKNDCRQCVISSAIILLFSDISKTNGARTNVGAYCAA